MNKLTDQEQVILMLRNFERTTTKKKVSLPISVLFFICVDSNLHQKSSLVAEIV